MALACPWAVRDSIPISDSKVVGVVNVVVTLTLVPLIVTVPDTPAWFR